jgi:hypothetical protein
VLALADDEVVAGEAVAGQVIGAPGDHVTIRAYSRPSTTYADVRPDAVLPSSGVLSYVFRPSTNTRMYVTSALCGPSPSVVVNVRPALTIAAHRDRPLVYTFSGRLSPAAVNEGRVVRLYYLSNGRSVQKGAGQVHSGIVSIEVRFAGPARLTMYLGTAANTTNAAGTSKNRPTAVF